MKVKKYKINVSDSNFTAVHNQFRMIDEVYIPEYNLYFNCENFIFTDDDHRVPEEYKEIEIDDNMIQLLFSYLKIKEDIDEMITNFFENNVD